jgi:hypothetical protein
MIFVYPLQRFARSVQLNTAPVPAGAHFLTEQYGNVSKFPSLSSSTGEYLSIKIDRIPNSGAKIDAQDVMLIQQAFIDQIVVEQKIGIPPNKHWYVERFPQRPLDIRILKTTQIWYGSYNFRIRVDYRSQADSHRQQPAFPAIGEEALQQIDQMLNSATGSFETGNGFDFEIL